MPKRTLRSITAMVWVIAAICFLIGFFFLPLYYDFDFTNTHQSPILVFIDDLLVIGGFLTLVGTTIWAAAYRAFRRKDIAIGLAIAVALLVYLLSISIY